MHSVVAVEEQRVVSNEGGGHISAWPRKAAPDGPPEGRRGVSVARDLEGGYLYTGVALLGAAKMKEKSAPT